MKRLLDTNMSKKKGDRRERQVVEIFTDAGFFVETPNFSRYENKDFYNLFDFMATHKDTEIIYGQVKSTTASGIKKTAEECVEMFNEDCVRIYYVVYHKREGWRLIRIDCDSGETEVVVDGRESDENMGVPIEEYLRTEVIEGDG